MLRGLLLYLHFRRLNGRTVGVVLNDDGLLGLRRVSVSAFGITGTNASGDQQAVLWGAAKSLRWGAKFDALVAASVAEHGDGHQPGGGSYRAFQRAIMAGDELEDELKPAISPEEVERVMAEERDTPC